jgi:rSAM/selenodomain-associated transferase 1
VGVAKAPTVAVLARAPSHSGKQRLFAALGVASDPALTLALLLDTLDAVLATRFHVLVGVDPREAVDEMRAVVPPHVDVVPQREGDLGERMRALMAVAFARGASRVLLVGSDLPDLSPDPLLEAAELLEQEPDLVVLGPAADGGYYLVAATRVPDIFSGILWGSDRVLADTEAAARQAGLRCRRVATQRDVDRVSDLLSVQAPRTRAWVQQARLVGLIR